MKNTILWSALVTLMSAQVYAEQGPATKPAQAPSPTMKAAAPNPAPAAAAPEAAAPTSAAPGPITTPIIEPQPQVQSAQPAAVHVVPAAAPVTPTPAAASQVPAINCDYKIPAETKKVEKSVVLKWAEQAVTQAFSFNPDSLDSQMQKLQACFTEQGWTGFSTALQKSGNVDAIKSQKLKVSSQMDGMAFINETKENQWKLTLPIVVVYQNDKEKVSQLLSVDLSVSRKPTGDLGITQMIATPRGTVTTTKPAQTAAPESTNPPAATPPASTNH